MRGFSVAGDSFNCEANEMVISAVCQGGNATPVVQGNSVQCNGATRTAGICMRQ